jgi:ATP-dependent DNA ligase
MFEKFDGVRGFWNPHQKTFFSRTGKPFLFPSHIISLMPNVILDGELW